MTLVIPKQLVEANARLILVAPNEKGAIEKGWNDDNNYPHDDPVLVNHLNNNGNYGVLSDENLHQIDIDNSELFRATGVKLPVSFTTKRGDSSGHGHYFFICDDVPEEFRHKHVTPWGDIRLGVLDSYVVGPGSTHPSGDKYEVKTDLPIAHLTFQELLELFPDDIKEKKKIDPSVYQSEGDGLGDELGLRCMDIAPPDKAKIAGDEIKGSHPFHGSTTGSNFSINQKKNLWTCHRHGTGGDALMLYAMKKGIIQCEDCEHGCLNEHMAEVFEELENDGYEIPEKNKPDIKFPFLEKYKATTEDKKSEDVEENIEKIKKIVTLPPLPITTHPIFSEWQDVASKLMYSRIPYHFANLLALTSMALNKKVCTELGLGKIRANVAVMVTGVSTISGKSYAASAAVNTFEDATVLGTSPAQFGCKMLRKVNSNASVVQDFCEVSNILWYYDEAREFFLDAEGWNGGVIKTVCTGYDGETLARRLSRRGKKKDKDDEPEVEECKEPFLSLLFNMTNDELEQSCTGSLFKSGFSPRFLWFTENGGEARKNVTPKLEDKQRIAALKEQIHHVSLLLKDLNQDSITFCVNDKIEEWKLGMSKKYEDSEFHQTAIGRGFVHIYKIAMIMTCFDPGFEHQIIRAKEKPITVDIPDNWVEEAIKIESEYLFPRMVGVLEMSRVIDRKNMQEMVIAALKKHGGSATRNELIRATRLASKDLSTTLATLINETEEVKEITKEAYNSKTKKTGPVPYMYILVKKE